MICIPWWIVVGVPVLVLVIAAISRFMFWRSVANMF